MTLLLGKSSVPSRDFHRSLHFTPSRDAFARGMLPRLMPLDRRPILEFNSTPSFPIARRKLNERRGTRFNRPRDVDPIGVDALRNRLL